MHDNLVVVCDNFTRFEGTSVATIVADKLSFTTSNTFYSSVDAGSLSDTFLKINSIGDSFVFFCVTSDVIFKKIKLSAFVDEIKNVSRNLQSKGCTPIICYNYFSIDGDFRKRKLRNLEKTLITMCHSEKLKYIRVNLLRKDEYFFSEEGKINLIESICDTCVSEGAKKKKSKFSIKEEFTDDRIDNGTTIVLKRARRVIASDSK